MKFIATSDWHIGNMFHGNDRLPEHRHFLDWLISQIAAHKPDALLVAGDVFDYANPSAAAQETYYKFLDDATHAHPDMKILITAGNHDSAYRLEAPRALLTRHNIEVRGAVHRRWGAPEDGGGWEVEYDDLIVPVENGDRERAVVLAVPYLRNDIVQETNYSAGVNRFIRELTRRAREKYPDTPLVMMAHMYAKGADIAQNDASEKIVIGGQEEVNMEGWAEHPDYMTCGHIHKRQHIWNTDWARYSGSILPMSFAETDYRHGVDLVTVVAGKKPKVEFLEYHPQHKLCIIPGNDEALSADELAELMKEQLENRKNGSKPGDDFVYLMLKVRMERPNNDDIQKLEAIAAKKNAVLCKIQKVIPTIDLNTIAGNEKITTIDDIINRDPFDTLKETFKIQNNREMSEKQERMVADLLESIKKQEGEES